MRSRPILTVLTGLSLALGISACGAEADTTDTGLTTDHSAESIVDQLHQHLTGDSADGDATALYAEALRAGVTLVDVAEDIVAETRQQDDSGVVGHVTRNVINLGAQSGASPLETTIEIPDYINTAYAEWAQVYAPHQPHVCP